MRYTEAQIMSISQQITADKNSGMPWLQIFENAKSKGYTGGLKGIQKFYRIYKNFTPKPVAPVTMAQTAVDGQTGPSTTPATPETGTGSEPVTAPMPKQKRKYTKRAGVKLGRPKKAKMPVVSGYEAFEAMINTEVKKRVAAIIQNALDTL